MGLLPLISCPSINRADPPPDLVLTHATLIDGRGGPPLSDATIIVRGGRVAAIGRLHQGGVLLTVGSDLASPWVIPGVAFHQELELLESAGLSRGDVLSMATRNGAQALGIGGEVGTIEVGKRADLVVLEADPMANLANTRRIRYVVLGGVAYAPADLLDGSRSSQRKER